MNSIGPLWDGNEVWLVTFGGALFAAFPVAYATVFSSFYTAFFLLLTCLIGRAVSLEFRSKVHSAAWRSLWDLGFFLSSFSCAFLLGLAGGNVMAGMELGPMYRLPRQLVEPDLLVPAPCRLLDCVAVRLAWCNLSLPQNRRRIASPRTQGNHSAVLHIRRAVLGGHDCHLVACPTRDQEYLGLSNPVDRSRAQRLGGAEHSRVPCTWESRVTPFSPRRW